MRQFVFGTAALALSLGGIVHPALQLFTGDARDGHPAYCLQRRREVSTADRVGVRMRVRMRMCRMHDPSG